MKKNFLKLFFNRQKIIFVVILLVAIAFRFTGLDWDQGHHLHPDERFLNMLINDMSLPGSFAEYLDPAVSPLNPRNNDRGFYVYGNAPVTINRLVVEVFNRQGLHEIALTGRVLSALADTLVLILIYKTVQLLEAGFKKIKINDKKQLFSPSTKLWACLVYALSVIPIQQSHFFTTDTFVNLFSFGSFYFALKYFFEKKLWCVIISGIFIGLAIGSKISGVLILPLVLSVIGLAHLSTIKTKNDLIKTILPFSSVLLAFFLIAYLNLRISSPYLFADTQWLNFNISPEFLQNLVELKSWEGNEVWFPPSIQWINRPFTFGIINLAIFGIGLPAFLFSVWGGVIWSKKSFSLFRKSNCRIESLMLAAILFWVLGFIGYYAVQFTKNLRYYLPILPILAAMAGLALSTLNSKLKLNYFYSSLLLLGLAIWPIMFLSIYIQPHSRIQASIWIYDNIPAGSLILSEHWDDSLPLHLSGFSHFYQIEQLPVFAQDNQNKWEEMENLLSKADYYILSSNRAWASIMRVPEKYPRMSQFYQDLFDEKTNYKLVAKFYSYPSLGYLGLPISFNNSWSEESFTVYDHPEVMIFQNSK